MFLRDVRARLAIAARRRRRARTRALDELRRQAIGSRDPQWSEPLELMSAQLAVREGRLEDARAAAARGLASVEGTDEGGRRLKLLWAALMVEADGAERAAARGEPFDDEVAAHARVAPGRGARSCPASGPRARTTRRSRPPS